MTIEASSIHASPVSQPDVPLVSAPPLDISHHAPAVPVTSVTVPHRDGKPNSIQAAVRTVTVTARVAARAATLTQMRNDGECCQGIQCHWPLPVTRRNLNLNNVCRPIVVEHDVGNLLQPASEERNPNLNGKIWSISGVEARGQTN
jgi:hypothetical protein